VVPRLRPRLPHPRELGGYRLDHGGRGSGDRVGCRQLPDELHGRRAVRQLDQLLLDGRRGATSYKLYESQSPSGVSGATALTGTSTTRSPSTARTYTYWLTATVAGVEGAKSADAVVSLPFGSTPGGGSGTGTGETPAEILDINGVSAADGGWWNLGIGFHSGDAEGSAHVDITPAVLANGYTRSPYFIANGTGSCGQDAGVLRRWPHLREHPVPALRVPRVQEHHHESGMDRELR
jgi:hypothetical protein